MFVCRNEDLNKEEVYGVCAQIIYKGHIIEESNSMSDTGLGHK